MSLQIAFQMDALARLNFPTDSTLHLARRALAHGCALFHYEPANLRLQVAKGVAHVLASGHELLLDDTIKHGWKLGAPHTLDLGTFDAVLIRQDPPFDLAYITTTHILDHIRHKVRVVNDPTGVRDAPEKLLLTRFPQLMPPTLITRDAQAIESFRLEHGDMVIKPLYSAGGRGVFHVTAKDDNLLTLIEMLSSQNNEPWVLQKFLPVQALGDKRIILLDGEPLGQFRRMPPKDTIRSNMRVGGKVESAPLAPRDREIIATIAPTLVAMGLRLVGLDVIGDYLTEINVTSPTGLVTLDQLSGHDGKNSVTELFWQKVLGSPAMAV